MGVPVARLSPTKLGNEQYQRIMQKYYEARETLSRMAERHGYVVYDTAKDNAIYDYKKNRILFTDITFEKKEHPDA